jgi:WD40 repeat protein
MSSKLQRQWNRYNPCTPSQYRTIYPPNVELPDWLQGRLYEPGETYYNVDFLVPLFFDIGRNEVAVVVYDQLFLFDPRTETFSAPVTIPLKSVNWHSLLPDYNAIIEAAYDGIVQKLIMIDRSKALIGFYESKLEVLINIDNGYVYDILEIDTLLYLGDNNVLITQNRSHICIYNLLTRTVVAKSAFGLGARTRAVLLSNNRIAVSHCKNIDLLQIKENEIIFISSKSVLPCMDISVIGESQVIYNKKNTMCSVDLDLDTEAEYPIGACWATTYGPKVMRITADVLLSFGINYTLCLYDMRRKTELMNHKDSGKSKQGYVSTVLSKDGFICLSERGGALYVWDLGWLSFNEQGFKSKLSACTAFTDLSFRIYCKSS